LAAALARRRRFLIFFGQTPRRCFGAALAAALLLHVVRAPGTPGDVPPAFAALVAAAAAAALASRAARTGFAAGLA